MATVRHMRRREFGLAVGAVLATGTSSSLAADSGGLVEAPRSGDLLASMTHFFSSVQTFSARFSRYLSGEGFRAQHGVLYFQKPGKFSWRYSSGEQVVSDGNVVKVYDPRKNRGLVAWTDGTQHAAPLSFLRSSDSLWEHRPAVLVDPAEVLSPNHYVVSHDPLCANAGYERLRVYLTSAFKVQRVEAYQISGKLVVIDFEKVRMNMASPWGEFRLRAPRFVTVVGGPLPGTTTCRELGPL